MSSNARRLEKRREDDAAYEREVELRNSREAEFNRRFGALRDRLEELGIDPYDLAAFVAAMAERS